MASHRQSISKSILTLLHAKSNNECSMPNCHNVIWDENNTYLGAIAHIEAYNEGGSRFNFNLTAEEKNDYDNLILICRNCHAKIDATNNISTFSVDILRQIKNAHTSKQKNRIELEKGDVEKLIERNQEKIKKILSFIDTTQIKNIDAPEEWLKKALSFYQEKERELECLGLPYSATIVPAFDIIFSSTSPFAIPIVRILLERLEIYFSVVNEVCKNYYERDSFRQELEEKYSKLKNFWKQQDFSIKRNVNQIAEAIKRNELYLYRDIWNSTNLRVVLKTLHEDKDNPLKNQKNELLDFIFKELVAAIDTDVHLIPETRHAWWALITLIEEKDIEWLKSRITTIEAAIHKFLQSPFISDKRDKKALIATELLSVELEDLWITVNLVRLLRVAATKYLPLSSTTNSLLQETLNNNIVSIKRNEEHSMSNHVENKFIFFCIKIVLFKEYNAYLHSFLET